MVSASGAFGKYFKKTPATIAILLLVGLWLFLQLEGGGVVTSVVDGDTIKVRTLTGELTVRLIGVNTPETRHPTKGAEPYGREAKEFTKKMLLGKRVYLEFDVQRTDKYGRTLAYVWLEKPRKFTEDEIREKMFNAILLLEGYAQIMTVPPNVKYADVFVELQREARQNSRGLWSLDYYKSEE
ncbi:thermonuclease family protein [Fervidobacterium thailandense]|uniref:Nuclease n=1 Tax=Fervidobacterium thailandense TaxID=1008305 RepID=A0A1E3G170_9BACT|nr:thermonuclease family protein [Fervidobacterium thailandense]ODN29987.1 nuclease [Fervidobacterium thailandense]